MPTPDSAPVEPLTFWGRRSVRRIVRGFAAMTGVVILGVVGYLALGWSFSDAFYMVAITVSGVGYGEVRPVTTTGERIHTIAVIAFGIVAVAYTMAGFLQFLAEGEIQRLLGHQRVKRQIETLSGHTIVAGYGRMGALICDELSANELPFVLIERSSDRIPEIDRRGFLYVQGEATEETVLKEAGLLRAKTLVTVVPSDADNVFITLTARQLAPKVVIIARAELPTSQKKLHQAGANHVVLPAAIGAHRMVSLLTNPSAVEFVDLVTHRSHLAIEMDEIPVTATSVLNGRTLRDADIGRRTGVIVVAIKRTDGRVEFPPSGNEPFAPGDSIVLLGRRPNLDQFRQQFCQGAPAAAPPG